MHASKDVIRFWIGNLDPEPSPIPTIFRALLYPVQGDA